MKFAIALFSLAGLLATVTAVATPSPAPEALIESRWGWCRWRGQNCSQKLKRTLDKASAEINSANADDALDGFLDYYCSIPGKSCDLAKRSADALTGALADAHAFQNPEKRSWNWHAYNCRWRGMNCSQKMKRAADTILAEFGEGKPEFPGGDDLADATPEERELANRFKEIAERLHAAAADFHLTHPATAAV